MRCAVAISMPPAVVWPHWLLPMAAPPPTDRAPPTTPAAFPAERARRTAARPLRDGIQPARCSACSAERIWWPRRATCIVLGRGAPLFTAGRKTLTNSCHPVGGRTSANSRIGHRRGDDGAAGMGVAAAVLVGQDDTTVTAVHPGHGVGQRIRSGNHQSPGSR